MFRHKEKLCHLQRKMCSSQKSYQKIRLVKETLQA